jgi:hypothetical protein
MHVTSLHSSSKKERIPPINSYQVSFPFALCTHSISALLTHYLSLSCFCSLQIHRTQQPSPSHLLRQLTCPMFAPLILPLLSCPPLPPPLPQASRQLCSPASRSQWQLSPPHRNPLSLPSAAAADAQHGAQTDPSVWRGPQTPSLTCPALNQSDSSSFPNLSHLSDGRPTGDLCCPCGRRHVWESDVGRAALEEGRELEEKGGVRRTTD